MIIWPIKLCLAFNLPILYSPRIANKWEKLFLQNRLSNKVWRKENRIFFSFKTIIINETNQRETQRNVRVWKKAKNASISFPVIWNFSRNATFLSIETIEPNHDKLLFFILAQLNHYQITFLQWPVSDFFSRFHL